MQHRTASLLAATPSVVQHVALTVAAGGGTRHVSHTAVGRVALDPEMTCTRGRPKHSGCLLVHKRPPSALWLLAHMCHSLRRLHHTPRPLHPRAPNLAPRAQDPASQRPVITPFKNIKILQPLTVWNGRQPALPTAHDCSEDVASRLPPGWVQLGWPDTEDEAYLRGSTGK